MNILFGFTWILNPKFGGTERVTDILARGLAKRGHTIFYLHTVENRPMDFDSPAVKDFYIPETIIDSPQGRESYEKILRKNNIDVVINQGGLMGTCKFLTSTDYCKKIVVIHFDPQYGYNNYFNSISTLRNSHFTEKCKRIVRCVDAIRRKRGLKQYLNELYSYWFQTADYVCLLSDKFYPDIYKVCNHIIPSKLTAINNPNTFTCVDDSYPQKRKQILWAGRLDMKQKRPDRIVKIWKRIYKNYPEWRLVIAGDGEAREYLETLSKDIPSIELVGRVALEPYYAESEIICMTSTIEGWGMVLTEAMAFGAVPIAFQSFASVKDLLTDRQLVTPFDTKEYTLKLQNLIEEPELRMKLRKNGFKILQNFDADTICKQWENLLLSLNQSTCNL